MVTLACVRGLTSRQGVFLRTPKKSERPRLVDAARIVWFEGLLATTCFAALGVMFVQHSDQLVSARMVLLAMLAWQGLLYASAARTSFWNYQSYEQAPQRLARLATNDRPRSMPEFRLAGRVLAASAAFGALFWAAVLFAPSMERVWRSDPLSDFITAQTLLAPGPEAFVGRQLIREADAARRRDIEMALALWDSDGVIRDHAFTPDVPDDDRVWRGRDEIRQRYEQEFRFRQYRQLRHLNLAVTFNGANGATIINDLDAVIETDRGAAHIVLHRTDRWTLRQEANEWRIVTLDVNRATRPADGKADNQLVITRRQQ